jgi:hypothetical protein
MTWNPGRDPPLEATDADTSCHSAGLSVQHGWYRKTSDYARGQALSAGAKAPAVNKDIEMVAPCAMCEAKSSKLELVARAPPRAAAPPRPDSLARRRRRCSQPSASTPLRGPPRVSSRASEAGRRPACVAGALLPAQLIKGLKAASAPAKARSARACRRRCRRISMR